MDEPVKRFADMTPEEQRAWERKFLSPNTRASIERDPTVKRYADMTPAEQRAWKREQGLH